MKKKIAMLALSAIMAFNLSACATGDTGLSETELNQVAEYAAKLVLKHTRNYEPSLQEELEIRENPEAVKENFGVAGEEAAKEPEKEVKEEDKEEDTKDTGEPEAGEAGNVNETATLNDIYNVGGFEVVYGGAGEYSRYPENEGYFSLVAADGMKLYVVKFSIRNKTKKDRTFSQGDGIAYNLTFDGKNYYKPSLTLLENDMQSLEVRIDGGNSLVGAVVFNVPKKEDRNKAKLRVTKGSKSHTLNVTQ